MTTLNQTAYWAIVPAAGIGSRMGAVIPKQYLSVRKKPIIAHTLEKLLSYPKIKKIIVVIHAQDEYWLQLDIAHHQKIHTVIGGEERYQSVLNGLNYLKEFTEEHDWVLVHDAVRPFISHELIDLLVSQLNNHPVGGILGIKVKDTLKKTNANHEILATIPRENIWQAQTPQLFRFNLLLQALTAAHAQGTIVTDEASALELLNYQPLIVEGSSKNFKITTQQDLVLAEHYLNFQK